MKAMPLNGAFAGGSTFWESRIVLSLMCALAFAFMDRAAGDPPDKRASQPDLLPQFLAGPMKDVEGIVFAMRKPGDDGHWYANFGYYGPDAGRKAYKEGGRLCRLNPRTGDVQVLLDDPAGGVRDPQVHYDGRRIVFSYRAGGSEHFHLYEIGVDGAGLRQLTDGPYDDIEPAYLPSGQIVFVSSRCKRWVNCWLTQVAVLHVCDADGGNIHAISSNNEHDNTPWPLQDGRLLYTRWEYVDRSQVHFHHLWAANPDGSGQINWFGNLHPGITMIDAKPIEGSDKVVASFSPGHGRREHDGVVTVIDINGGPDRAAGARSVSKKPIYRDPWGFSEDCFMAASGSSLVVMNGTGVTQEILRLSEADRNAGFQCHEPRPLTTRGREPAVPRRVDRKEATGRLLLADVNHGRNMDGVSPGEIKKLLVLETLPMPIHYTGGMEPISYGGSFTLERILGTVPVEPDGSAYFETPALRSVFFVALDENDMAVKRMQSFASILPGETAGCVGCHEHRTSAPPAAFGDLMALRKGAVPIEPIRDVPEVFDYPRDIQPILNALCVDCHGYDRTDKGGPRAGRLLLTGDRGPIYSHSYYMMTIARLFSDGRNQPRSNYAPRKLGSSNSRILKMLDGSHYGVKATSRQKKLLRLWIESASVYPGTYAALGCGMIGNYIENHQVNTGHGWPETKAGGAVVQKRCQRCHKIPARRLPMSLADERGVSFWKPSLDDPRLNTSRHIVFNLSRPEKSMMLLAPLAELAGGWGMCLESGTKQPVFAGKNDPDYRTLLAMVEAGKRYLDENKRFDMPGFRPREAWVREMRRYGILPDDTARDDVADVYAVESRYWESLWHRPAPLTAGGGEGPRPGL